ncbi:SGNH/GDSL hydrolase family protein [Oryzihumus sp.]|uniref:SGNH/GDSL hydrolase family protein n=1 Tax=Oryzihumus sp. TaxID=1968903 RepID=UPI002EDB13F0
MPSASTPRPRHGPLRRLGLLAAAAAAVVATVLVTAGGTGDAHPPVLPGSPGSSGPPAPPVRVVGIGDSVTAGTACDCTDFVRLYAQGLTSHGTPATASNLGVGGMTAAGLLDAVRRPGPLRDGVAGADVLLVTIGANDLMPQLQQWAHGGCPASCWAPSVRRVADTVAELVRTARQLRGAPGERVLVTGYWNVFDDGDEAAAARGTAYLAWSDGLSRALNVALCDAARGNGATCVDLYTPFKGDGSRNPTPLLASDGDHPNAAGHRLIAGALLAASGR